jgi:DNA transformation protein and related proteins
MLEAVGITNVDQLRALGSVEAFFRVKQTDVRASLNLLWALEGAISNEPWQHVARKHRTSLLLALEDRANREDQPASEKPQRTGIRSS